MEDEIPKLSEEDITYIADAELEKRRSRSNPPTFQGAAGAIDAVVHKASESASGQVAEADPNLNRASAQGQNALNGNPSVRNSAAMAFVGAPEAAARTSAQQQNASVRNSAAEARASAQNASVRKSGGPLAGGAEPAGATYNFLGIQ